MRGRAGAALAVALSLACATSCASPRRAAPPSPATPAAPGAPPPTPAPLAPVGAERYGGPEPRVALAPEEAAAIEVARGRAGAERAAVSGSLVIAARALALRAAAGDPEPLARPAIRAALSQALAYDPAPAAFLVRGAAARLGEPLAAAMADTGATHLGAGVARVDDLVFLVVLASDRKARLAAFPRAVEPGQAALLSGELARGLRDPRVFVTSPSGDVREVEVSGGGGAFRARVPFPAPGRYLVEVVARGESGPQVAVLLAATAGAAAPDVPSPPLPEEPEALAASEAAVVRAVNELRRARGLGPVKAAPELAAVARRHSEAMLAAGRVAHVLPRSGELVDRLRAGGIAYRRAFENVARGRTALAAHQVVEESPAHLGNLLQADTARIGVGVARGRLASGDPSVYLTEILVQPPDDGDGGPRTADARVREALWRERARLGAPPLTADEALDALAAEAAEAMRARDAPDPADLGERALALRRGVSAVDVFVASAPDEVSRSANLRDRRFRRVGVGVASGDGRRFGARRLWIAVVYTD